MSKTIFITGANGFLGSRIAIIAKKRKYNVIALVRESSNLENLKKLDIELCVGDLRDKESLRPGIKKAEIIFWGITSIGTNTLLSIEYSFNKAPLPELTLRTTDGSYFESCL